MCNNKHCCYPCNSLVEVTGITPTSTELNISIPAMPLVNNQRICLYNRNFNMPILPEPLPVVLVVNSESLHLIDKRGNYIYSDQLNQYDIIPLEVATDSKLLVHQGCCLVDSNVSYPTIVVPTTPPVEAPANKVGE